jgi:branched-chain amino acid transport system ATP-binding protein
MKNEQAFLAERQTGYVMSLLDVRKVKKIYGELTALSDASFTVTENEFHGLIGPNGSGKSTLLKCIAGAEIVTTGEIHFCDQQITYASPAARARAGLALKFQITAIMPTLSVFDNVLLAMQARSSLPNLIFSSSRRALHEPVMEMLKQFRLADRASDRASALSHGQQQWLETAMALSQKPRLLLLDEPTGGMSVEERRVTGELLQPIKSHCSIVIVEHDLDFIRDFSDRVTVLDQGAVLATGSVQEIQNNDKVQEVYLRRV